MSQARAGRARHRPLVVADDREPWIAVVDGFVTGRSAREGSCRGGKLQETIHATKRGGPAIRAYSGLRRTQC
jgi:hypothetical protein